LRQTVDKVCRGGSLFAAIHVFQKHGDIEDMVKSGPRLVVMPPDHGIAYSRNNEKPAFAAAQEILDKRGNQPRSKANRLVFLFPDFNAVNRLRDDAAKYLAWQDIVEACEQGTLTLDNLQQKNAKNAAQRSLVQLEATARECYNFAIAPGAKDARTADFCVERINTQNGSIAAAVESWLVENEFLIRTWSPIFLKQLLDKYYFKNGVEEVSIKKVWNDTCSYLYMPRIRDEETFIQAFTAGIATKEYFGYAEGMDPKEKSVLGFRFGESVLLPALDDSMLVISKKKALELDEKRKCPKCGQFPCVCKSGEPDKQTAVCQKCGNNPCTCLGKQTVCPKCGKSPCQCVDAAKKHYFGTIELDPLDPVVKMSDVLENVIALFTARPGVNVRVKLDIEASSASAFDKNTVVRPVVENSKNLGFVQSEFTAE